MHLNVVLSDGAVDNSVRCLNVQKSSFAATLFVTGGGLGSRHGWIHREVVGVVLAKTSGSAQSRVQLLLQSRYHPVKHEGLLVHQLGRRYLVCPSPKHLVLFVLQADCSSFEELCKFFTRL